MDVFNRARFLTVPIEQPGPIPIQIGHHRVVMPITPIGKERPLRLEQAQSHVAQGFAVLLLCGFSGHEVHFRPLSLRAVGFRGKGLPVFFTHLAQGCSQLLTHHRADRKANPSPRLLLALGMLEPPDELVLVAGRVAPEVASPHRLGQRRKGHLRAGQRRLAGGYVPISKFIGDHQIGLRPQRHHRLIAPASFVMSQGRLLVALNHGGVLVNGGHFDLLALLGIKLGNTPDQAGLDLLESLHRLGAGQNETLLVFPFGPQGGHVLIVKAVEE